MAKRDIALMIGPNSVKIISEHLAVLNDYINLTSYDTLQNLIKVSKMRNKFFERVVFSSKVLNSPDKDLKELSDYLYEFSSNTSLVFIARSDQKDLVKKFTKVFKAPLYTVAFIDNPTIKDLSNVVECGIEEIKSRYSKKAVNVEEKIKEVEQPKEQEKQVPVEEPKKEKKRGFFSRLFGGKEKKVEEVEPTLEEKGNEEDLPVDLNNLSLGAFANSHADTGFLDDSSLDLNVEISQPVFSDFTPKVESLILEAEMPELPKVKPAEKGFKTVEKFDEMKETFSENKNREVLVKSDILGVDFGGKFLLIGSNNELDAFSKNFEAVVDLDLVYRPMRRLVNLNNFDLSERGIKGINFEGQSLFSEVYSAPDINFRREGLRELLVNFSNILVNASLADLDDIKDCLDLFDTILILDNNDLELYLDFDNEERVSSDVLAKLKSLNPICDRLNKNYLVARKVW